MPNQKEQPRVSNTLDNHVSAFQKLVKVIIPPNSDDMSEPPISGLPISEDLLIPSDVDDYLTSSKLTSWKRLLTKAKDISKLADVLTQTDDINKLEALLAIINQKERPYSTRTIDLLTDNDAQDRRLTGVSDMLAWGDGSAKSDSEFGGTFSDSDWQSFLNELEHPDCIFTTDLEMELLNSSNVAKAARYRVPALYTGRAQIDGKQADLTGNLNACIEYYKSNAN